MAEIMEPLFGRGRRSARIMFVFDTVSEEDYYDHGKIVSDKAGKLLTYALKKVGIDPTKDCYFTALCKQPTPENRQPNKEEIQAFEKYLDKEISLIDPEIIVPMGNVSLKKIGGRTGITKFRGKATIIDDGVIVFPIISPDMLFLQPKHSNKWTKDIQNLAEILDQGASFLERKEVDYRYLETVEDVLKEIKRMSKSKWVVFDLETTGLNPFEKDAKIVCISLTDKDHYGVTIPLDHQEFEWDSKDFKKVRKAIKLLLENKNIKKMAHNGKFDIKWLKAKYGFEVANFKFDPLLCHYLTVSEEQGGHGLKNLAWEFTDMGGYDNDLDAYKDTLPEAKRHNYDNIPWDILKVYAAADVDCTFRLYKKFRENLKNNAGWRFVFNELLLPGSYALMDIEINGVKMDLDRIEEYERVFPERIKEIEEKLRMYPEVVQIEREKLKLVELRQREMKKPKEERDPEILKYNKYKNFRFKFSSTAQLRELLFEKLGLDTPFLTDKGKERKQTFEKQNRGSKEKFVPTLSELSTGKETLTYLDGKHPIASLLSEWRRIDKVFGTYVKPARGWIGTDGLAHPNYNLTGTVTGRLSSENPNAQNFPRKSNNPKAFEYINGIKKMFISRFGDDGLILQADYSQLELRIAAIFSSDKALVKAYKDGKDIHTYVASKVYKVPESEVTSDQRTAAKAVGFGLLYGKGAFSLAEDMGVELDEAKDFIDTYFKEFAGVKKWLDNTRVQVLEEKYVKTLTGRYRRLEGIDSTNRGVAADASRQAINSPIQGTGSDITLMSIILLNKRFKEENLKSVVCMTVHDSIVGDVYRPELERVHQIMKEVMENPPYEWVTVPIVADFEIGYNYGDIVDFGGMKEVEEEYDGNIDLLIETKLMKKKEKDLADYEKSQKKTS